MLKLKNLIPENVCLACEGCCRYAERHSVWQPLFLFEEIVELTEKNVLPTCLFTHAHGRASVRGPARIDLLATTQGFICPCFDMKDNRCKIYAHRPFDCQLYPFVLLKRHPKAYLGVDEKCPYIQKHLTATAAKDYIEYLLDIFSTREFCELLKNNPDIIQDYPHDIKILVPLP